MSACADASEFRNVQELVARIVSGKEPGLGGPLGARREGLTVAKLAALWTTGDLAKQYPDHVRAKRSSGEDARMLGWLGKVRMPDGVTFGSRPVASVSLDDCDYVITARPKTTASTSSRRQYA
ncbi:MAG: hypothetical protein ACREJ3_14940 [Polyangiaceae bacterium]